LLLKGNFWARGRIAGKIRPSGFDEGLKSGHAGLTTLPVQFQTPSSLFHFATLLKKIPGEKSQNQNSKNPSGPERTGKLKGK